MENFPSLIFAFHHALKLSRKINFLAASGVDGCREFLSTAGSYHIHIHRRSENSRKTETENMNRMGRNNFFGNQIGFVNFEGSSREGDGKKTSSKQPSTESLAHNDWRRVLLIMLLRVCGQGKGRNADGVKTSINSDDEDMETHHGGTNIWLNNFSFTGVGLNASRLLLLAVSYERMKRMNERWNFPRVFLSPRDFALWFSSRCHFR